MWRASCPRGMLLVSGRTPGEQTINGAAGPIRSMKPMSNVNNSKNAIPCYRCGAPVAHGVEGLRKAMEGGTVSATAAYYVHGTGDAPTCGDVIVPGGSSDRAVYGPFRKAVAVAMGEALKAEGFIRVMHVPMPVKAGGEEERVARAESERLNALRNAKSKGTPTVMSDACLFVLVDGAWTLKSAAKPAIPAPPPPPGKGGTVAPPPPPPVRTVSCAMAADGSVREMSLANAKAALAEGSVYAVLVGGAWVETL